MVFPITRRPGFGEVLRGHRRAARLTLEQLAELSGVSARTLSEMERGRSKGPQHRTVTALADALALAGDGLLHDSAAGRYRFHDLVRLFARTRLEEEEPPAERAALTARVTSWLPPAGRAVARG